MPIIYIYIPIIYIYAHNIYIYYGHIYIYVIYMPIIYTCWYTGSRDEIIMCLQNVCTNKFYIFIYDIFILIIWYIIIIMGINVINYDI